MKRKLIWGAQLLLVVLCALALKFYYSTATPDELRWILAPTTALVELLSGRSFTFESYAGYMSSDHRFVIAVSCAGVNFLLTAFLMLGLRRLWRERLQAVSWSFLPVAAVVAYVTTVLANTVRIWIALEIQERSLQVSGLSGNQLHRFEGIVVYFGFLLLLFMLTEKRNALPSRRLVLFPLGIYYATTLGLPLLNGSYKQGAPFLEHLVFVLTLPLILAFFVGAALRGRPASNRSLCQTTESIVLARSSFAISDLSFIVVPKDRVPRRAATEGRPYSTFRDSNFLKTRSGGPCGYRIRHILRGDVARWCDED